MLWWYYCFWARRAVIFSLIEGNKRICCEGMLKCWNSFYYTSETNYERFGNFWVLRLHFTDFSVNFYTLCNAWFEFIRMPKDDFSWGKKSYTRMLKCYEWKKGELMVFRAISFVPLSLYFTFAAGLLEKCWTVKKKINKDSLLLVHGQVRQEVDWRGGGGRSDHYVINFQISNFFSFLNLRT